MDQKFTLIAAVAACSAAGFMVGRIGSESSQEAAISPDTSMGPGGFNKRGAMSGSNLGPRASMQSSARDVSPRGQRGVSGLPAGDPVALMESIVNNPDPLERAEQWLRFVKGLDPVDIGDVVASFRGKGLASANLSEYSMLLSTWAKHDPLAALDYASENTGSPFARQAILTTWATTDPIAAMRWAEDNHEGNEANPWMVGVIRGIAASDPERATQLMNSMPYSRERGDALSAVMGHYLKQGPDTARAWALGIEDERLRAGAISRIADNLARIDPKGTADWLLANPGEGASRAMDDVMERMAEQDTQAALSYFQSINDPALKSSALEGITDQLAAKDPQASLALMDANPELVTDDVVQEFVWSARREDPALAANNIARIQDAGDRNRTYRRYMWGWMRDDMDGAMNWVNQTELPEDVRRTVNSIAERMQNDNER